MHEDPTKCVCQGKGVFYQMKPIDFKNWVDPYPEVPMAQAEKVNCKYHHPDSAYYQAKQKEEQLLKWMNQGLPVYNHTKKPYVKFGVDPAGTKTEMTSETMWFLSEKELKQIEPDPNIDYPDGWLEEDLSLWCKDQGVPLPKYLRNSKYYRGWDGANYLTYKEALKTKPSSKEVGQVLWSGTIKIENPKFHSQVTNWVTEDTKDPFPLKTKAPAKLATDPSKEAKVKELEKILDTIDSYTKTVLVGKK